VKTSLHGQRVGQRIIAMAKEYLISIGIRDILTYADREAVKFFEKQDFKDKIRRPTLEWKKNVNHYVSSIPMQCLLLPDPNQERDVDFYRKFDTDQTLEPRCPQQLTLKLSLSTAHINHCPCA